MERQPSLIETPSIQAPPNSSVCGLLPPPNPIITKSIHPDEKIALRINTLTTFKQQSNSRNAARPKSHQQQQQQSAVIQQQTRKVQPKWKPYMEVMTLTNGYQPNTLMFKRFNNDTINRRGKKQYFSSLFVMIQGNRGMRLPEYKGMLRDDDLIFDSNFESANLMAVFKIEDKVYDLVLQNDVNTRGFTQWYNFKVTNRRNNFIAKFNIVNLYKSKSLYSIGMKPIVRSEKSDKKVKKTWRRKGYKIYYEKNGLSYEDNNKKCYKTLTFQYDFTIENDTVQFAHGMPYDLHDLQLLLTQIKTNPRVKMMTIGNTLMGRPIPLMKISAVEDPGRLQKKALVILARQHPGETPGSYIAQQIVLQLLRNSNEVDFLAWRFDIFVFPMVNQDGVHMGNYRSNFAGFDLNRSWLRPHAVMQPEVVAIKNYIKKLQKKYKIQLILDLHGHSRKMGSFFYGNKFGSNFMLFPYIASKGNHNILFQKSRFSHESQQDIKGSTARVVLGNMLKQTGGYVYTYQVSFFGNYKEDHTPFAFQEEHYKELARTLVQSIYKTYLELYKEEKTLKESYFLKSTKYQLQDIAISRKIDDEEASGSDSEAEEQMEEEVEQIQQFFEEAKYLQEFSPPPIEIPRRPSAYQGIDRQISISKRMKDLKQLGEPVEEHSEEVKLKIEQLLQKNLNDDLRKVILQRLPSIRRENQRQGTLNSIKRQIVAANDFRGGQQIEGYQTNSVQSSKGKKYGLLQHFRVKKYKNQADWLKISGQTFALHERERHRQIIQSQKQRKELSYEKSKQESHQIKQNLLLINHDSESTDIKAKRDQQMTAIDIINSLKKPQQRQKNEQLNSKQLRGIQVKLNTKQTFKQLPLELAFDEAAIGPIRVNRVYYQRQQNRARRLQEAPNKQPKQVRSKLPAI